MKAMVRETYGAPDVLHLEEVPLPTIRDEDVLVRVQAASANADTFKLAGLDHFVDLRPAKAVGLAEVIHPICTRLDRMSFRVLSH